MIGRMVEEVGAQRGEKADEFSFLVFSSFSNSLLAFLMLIRVTADSGGGRSKEK